MVVTVILNTRSGLSRQGAAEADVRETLQSVGLTSVRVLPLEPALNLETELAENLRSGCPVVAVGGDGTVSSVAAVLAGTETPLGILPAGTLNHFARDLGIPTDLPAAAAVIAKASPARVDVARLNERVFVNNSSIGLYPAMVRVRDRLMTRGWPKRAALVAGSLAAVWQFPNLRLRLSTSGAGVVTRTPFVFVGNNSYELSGFDAGTRAGLQDGVLQVCTVRNPTRMALFAGAVQSFLGRTPDIHLDHAPEVYIRTLRHRVRVALDGEVVLMRSPLRYSIWPKALRVLVP